MSQEKVIAKVPVVTLAFWIIKIAATTLGETGGDTVTMTMNLGYLIGTAIFVAILAALVVAQIAAKRFHPFLYWATIIASTTAGTTMADFCRSLARRRLHRRDFDTLSLSDGRIGALALFPRNDLC